jgi:hypothetical protein
MPQTIDLIKIWLPKLIKADLTLKDVEALQECICENSLGYRPKPMNQEKLTYSEDAHTSLEAMADFALAVSHCLSNRQLFRLTKVVLAHQSTYIDNTYLRNNELARFLLMIEMGKIPAKRNGDLPPVLMAHLNTIARAFSDSSLLSFINTLLIGPLNTFKQSYKGANHLITPTEVSITQMAFIRNHPSDIANQLNNKPPHQPTWLDFPKLEQGPLAIQTLFQKAADEDTHSQPLKAHHP